MNKASTLIAIFVVPLSCAMGVGQAPPGYNTPIPPEIMTPDEVKTEQLGTLKFFDGMPDPSTVEKVYENLDRMRGVEAFLDLVPLASIEAMRRGMAGAGIDEANKILLFEELMDSNALFFDRQHRHHLCHWSAGSRTRWANGSRDSVRCGSRNGQRRVFSFCRRHGCARTR